MDMDFDLLSIAAYGWAGKLASAGLALILLVALLRWLDRRASIDFPEFAKDMRNAPQASAIYLGLRFLGAALLVGLVLAFS